MSVHQYIGIGIISLTGIILLYVVFKRLAYRSRLKKVNFYKSQWGKTINKHRPINEISIFYNNVRKDMDKSLDQKTWQDLDMDRVFSRIDATVSKIGEQKLYQILHAQNFNYKDLKELDDIVEYFDKNEIFRTDVQLILDKLSNQDLYFFPVLFTEKIPSKPHYYWIYPLLSFLNLAVIITCLIKPFLIWIIIIMFIASMILHYTNKLKIGSYIDSFRNIGKISTALRDLLKLKLKVIDNQKLKQEIAGCKTITRKTNWLSFDFREGNEITALFYWIMEIFKALFMIEPILYYSALRNINQNKDKLKDFFELIGNLDVAISIASFRRSLKIFSKPKFSDSETKIELSGLYHPLITDCVENDMLLSDRSAFITGSNMAGKSTFIRAIGINIILSQTVYTSLSKKYKSPFVMVFSSINISDNILSGKSYFQMELDSIKRLIAEAKKEERCVFLIDELFKGTNTFDRLSISKSVLSFLASKNTVFVSTHDIELAPVLSQKFNLYYFRESIVNDKMTFDYKLNPGKPKSSNAIKLLELNGYPESILQEAIQFKERYNHT
jgi:DNA mismatch repair ATPase MutS